MSASSRRSLESRQTAVGPLLPLGSQAPQSPHGANPPGVPDGTWESRRGPPTSIGLKIRGIKVPGLHVDTIKAKAREFRQATRCAFSALNVSSAWQGFRLAPAIPGLQAPEPALLTPQLPPVDCSLPSSPQDDGRALSAATICRPCFWRGPAFSALAAQRTPFDC